jgi:hypothetical protein
MGTGMNYKLYINNMEIPVPSFLSSNCPASIYNIPTDDYKSKYNKAKLVNINAGKEETGDDNIVPEVIKINI